MCTYDELIVRNGKSKTVGRKHIAVEMVRQGISIDVDDAFDTYSERISLRLFQMHLTLFHFLRLFLPTSAGGIVSLRHLFEYKR